MKLLKLLIVLALLAANSAYADNADILAYEKMYFSDEEDAPVNSGYISGFARSQAKHAQQKALKSILVAKSGIQQFADGDTAIGGLIIKPGVDLKHVRNIYVVGNKVNNVGLTK